MGRRHFHYSPAARGAPTYVADGVGQNGILGSLGAGEVVNSPQRRHSTPISPAMNREALAEPQEAHVPGRRMYGGAARTEASDGGSVEDQYSIPTKRRVSTPSKSTVPGHTVKRQFDKIEHMESTNIVEHHAPEGRRHTRGPADHLAGNAARVVRDDKPIGIAKGSRRHCTGTPREKVKGLPAQRRHIQVEDHMVGAYMCNPDRDPPVTGTSKARPSSTPPTYGVAAALIEADRQQRSKAAAGSQARAVSGRRHIEPEGNLFGGTVNLGDGRTFQQIKDESRSGKRPIPRNDNLIGCRMRHEPERPPASGRAASPSRHEDNLFGPILREAAPATPNPKQEVSKGSPASREPMQSPKPGEPVRAKRLQMQTGSPPAGAGVPSGFVLNSVAVN